jgi:hypothetical protein
MDRDSTTRTGAKDPWGREEKDPLKQRREEALVSLDAEPEGRPGAESREGWGKLTEEEGMPGAGLTSESVRKASSEMLALKPYRGKPAVRNFREGDGNVGIIRSPVRAITLPDHGHPAETRASR